MEQLNDCSTPESLLRSRRSASAKAMGEPGPTPGQLNDILEMAVRVPDHGKLTPWRFILIEGDARRALGEQAAARYHELYPDHGEEMLAAQRGNFLRAPVVLTVVSTAREHVKIPIWEQQLSAGALCHNILLAATALGVGCQWISGWHAYDAPFLRILGLEEHETAAGFLYMGTPTEPLSDRPRPDPQALLTRWSRD